MGSWGNRYYNLIIPANQVAGINYRIRITSTTNAAYTDTSDANFTILAPTITVGVPSRREVWATGSTQTITWTYPPGNPGVGVKIELLKGGVLNSTITAAVNTGSGGNGSYSWTIPGNPTLERLPGFRITSTTNAAYTDTSNANFTITGPPPPTITVVTPNGWKNWAAGSTQTITWTYTGNPGSAVKIELLNAGSPSIPYYAVVGSGGNGSYNLIIPANQVAGIDYRIRITSITNAAYTDTSDANFHDIQ